jgi:hypothetical protein
VRIFGVNEPLSYVLLWLGVSIGMHAFPSTVDAKALWRAATSAAGRFNLFAVLSLPLVVAIYVANILSIVWFDYLYGVALGLGLPELVYRQLL